VISSALLRGTTHPHPRRRQGLEGHLGARGGGGTDPRLARSYLDGPAGIRTAIKHLTTVVKTHDPLSPSKTPRWSDYDTPR
jgi:hypothetical protein